MTFEEYFTANMVSSADTPIGELKDRWDFMDSNRSGTLTLKELRNA